MNGPQHYQEADRLLAEAAKRGGGYAGGYLNPPEVRAELHAAAQVHALQASTAMAFDTRANSSVNSERDWREVLV